MPCKVSQHHFVFHRPCSCIFVFTSVLQIESLPEKDKERVTQVDAGWSFTALLTDKVPTLNDHNP